MSYYKDLHSYLYTKKESFEEYYNSLQSEEEKINFIKKLYKMNYRGSDNDDGQELAYLYSERYIQEFYFLRYMYAYAYEYREMFTRLLTEQNLHGFIEILSVGCGNGIDYWAIREAEQSIIDNDTGADRHTIQYTGLDEIDWYDQWGGKNYKMVPKKGMVTYKQIDAAEYFENAQRLPYNVIIFPKSISEFSDGEFTRICNALGRKEFKFEYEGRMRDRNEVHFLISLRKVDGISQVDRERIRLLKEAMEANEVNGFKLSNPATVPVQEEEFYTEDGSGITAYDQSFRYPGPILNFLQDSMYRTVLNFIQGQPENTFEFTQGKSNGAIEEDVKRMFTPMLKTQYICNTIMTFRRCQ